MKMMRIKITMQINNLKKIKELKDLRNINKSSKIMMTTMKKMIIKNKMTKKIMIKISKLINPKELIELNF